MAFAKFYIKNAFNFNDINHWIEKKKANSKPHRMRHVSSQGMDDRRTLENSFAALDHAPAIVPLCLDNRTIWMPFER